MIKIQARASHLSVHDFRLFSTIHSGSVTKCHLRMHSSIEWFNIFFLFFTPQSTILAHVSQRLKVSYCDLSLSGERQPIHKTFAFIDNWSKLKIYAGVFHIMLFFWNRTNDSAPPNKRAARALDMKSYISSPEPLVLIKKI